MKDLYMHTLDGRPAEWQSRTKTVVYSGRRVTRFATSLQQIRREQALSIEHYGDADGENYDYVRIARAAFNGEASGG